MRATPTFFINGRKVEGSLEYSALANYIDALEKGEDPEKTE